MVITTSHVPLEGGGAADVCEARINNFFICTKPKILN
jgi:hypothetical protein